MSEASAIMHGGSYECWGSCWCDAELLCSATLPNQDGECLHGFAVHEFCGEGRPLLADGEVRVAPARSRADWLTALPTHEQVPACLRDRVARGWAKRAAMEHASVAAFARFAIQLLGLGAPAELIAAAQRAGRDELRHARWCYTLASRVSGRPVGPGPLNLAGLAVAVDPDTLVWESILEGCIGETIAAAKMGYLAARALDPALAQLLGAIAEDEARHAALAWRALRFMIAEREELRATAELAFARVLASTDLDRLEPPEQPDACLGYGVLDEATSAWISAEILRGVIAPAAGLLGSAGSRSLSPTVSHR